MLAHVFGPWTQWPEQDLVAFSDEFDEELALAAHCSGLFPMPLHQSGFEGEMGWWSPMERAIIRFDDLRVTRSLRKMVRRYTTTTDACFTRVLDGCADPSRPDGWIDPDIRRVYTALYERGLAHSVETWDAEGRLVGGLYGVSIGRLFAGESMFHDPVHGRDASKVALVRLVAQLRASDPEHLLDVQWLTEHLASLGAVEVDRVTYLSLLDVALEAPTLDWEPTSLSGGGSTTRLGGERLLALLEQTRREGDSDA